MGANPPDLFESDALEEGLQFPGDHAVEESEDADQIGFAGAVAADKNVQIAQPESLVPDGLEVFDRQLGQRAQVQ